MRSTLRALLAAAALSSQLAGAGVWLDPNAARLDTSNRGTVFSNDLITNVGAELQLLRPVQGGGGTAFSVTPTTCPGGVPAAAPVDTRGNPLMDGSIDAPLTTTLDLATLAGLTDHYAPGEPLFIRAHSFSANADPAVRDSVELEVRVTLDGKAVDSGRLLLHETGNDTSTFVGYLQPENGATARIDANCAFFVPDGAQVRLRYTDNGDTVETVQVVTALDPYSNVFDAATGKRISGATITLVRLDAKANARGDHGEADFPEVLRSGDSFHTPTSNHRYNFREGSFRFPQLPPGRYRYEVKTPDGYSFPSRVARRDLADGDWEVDVGDTASRGGVFTVTAGSWPRRIDIPLDRANPTELFVSKRATRNTAAAGDFVQFIVEVENSGSDKARNPVLHDLLPQGFRYIPGSLRIDERVVADPVLDANGLDMAVDLPDLASGRSVTLRYVTEVTVGTKTGEVVNTAWATADYGTGSNTAVAGLVVVEDLFLSRSVLVGRVFVDSCGKDPLLPGEGVEGVRLYMEDGTTVVTDSEGRWHIAGIRTGGHVVQVDRDSLNGAYELLQCIDNTRYAGNPGSQFVDIQGGGLWRADFYLSRVAPVATAPTPAAIAADTGFVGGALVHRLASKRVDNQVEFSLRVRSETIATQDAAAQLRVTPAAVLVPGSFLLDGNPVQATAQADGSWQVPLGDIAADAARTLTFRADARMDLPEVEASARVAARSPRGDALQTPPASNSFRVQAPPPVEKQMVLRPRFKPGADLLEPAHLRTLDDAIRELRGMPQLRLDITGHTDSTPIERGRNGITNNDQLSQLRARAVADYLRQALGLPADAVTASGVGPREPVASNSTVAGREQNRRVEIVAKSMATPDGVDIAFGKVDSGELNTASSARRVGDAAGTGATPVVATTAASTPAAADNTPGFVNFRDGQHVAQPVQMVKVRMDARLRPQLLVDDREVAADRIGYRAVDEAANIATYGYVGVDLGGSGPRRLTVRGIDPFGNKRLDQAITVERTGDIRKLRVLATDGNIADGRTPISIRLELQDEQLRAVASEARLGILAGDLRPLAEDDPANPLLRPGAAVGVALDGTVRFAPVTQAGRYRMRLAIDADTWEDIDIQVAPYYRDWILVGFAEGTAAHSTLSGNLQAATAAELQDGYYNEGRAAFFARGRIQGNWLLTMAYDSDKETDAGLQDAIDPNAWYTVYGDASQQVQDAPSQEKLYLKIERDRFYALFGDYDTGFTVTELSRYSRPLTGVKSEYIGDKVEATVFASQTTQGHARDEIRGNGTSGLYRLSHRNIVLGSEKITLQVRDRFRSEVVLEERELTRYLDYSIDTYSGVVWFKEPVMTHDGRFNPRYIIAEYETDTGIEDSTGGGRVVLKPNDKVSLGLTGVQEGYGTGEATLAGADLTVQLDERNTLVIERAGTDDDAAIGAAPAPGPAGPAGYGSGSAHAVIHRYESERLATELYAREQDEEFGIGQTMSSEQDTRKEGGNLRYQLTEQLSVNAETYREEQLSTGDNRVLLETRLNQDLENTSFYGGLRTVRDDYVSAALQREADQVIAGTTHRMLEDRLELSLDGEANTTDDPQSLDYPNRVMAGADYRLNSVVTLYSGEEFAWSDDYESSLTTAGVRMTPWTGGQVTTGLGRESNEYGPRVYANSGLVQNWLLNARWTVDGGFDRVETLEEPAGGIGTGLPAPYNPDFPLAPLTQTEDYTATFLGAAYDDGSWRWQGRNELRFADSEDAWNLFSGLYRELNRADTVAGSLRHFRRSYDTGGVESESTLSLGFAHRPLAGRWIVLDRTDLVLNESRNKVQDLEGQRLVNNLNANWQLDDENQLGLQLGAKYVFDTIDAARYTGFTDVMGMEFRHDITPQWDLGVRTSILHSWNADVVEESWGLFAGWSPLANVWISVGYNFKGFSDYDFDGAAFRDEGFNMAFRIKLDEGSTQAVIDRFSSADPLAGAGETDPTRPASP